MLPEVCFQRCLVLLQVALWTIKREFLELVDAPGLVVPKIMGDSWTADAEQCRNFSMQIPLTFEIQGFHFPLHARMRMVKALIM